MIKVVVSVLNVNERIKIMFKWLKLISWIKQHRKKGNASFDVVTNNDTFVITVSNCKNTTESWKENMLRIPYK